MKVKLGDIARESRETISGSKNELPIVGLEHLTSGELTLTSWDIDKENTFTKLFRKGHILFGRRRAYLKKAALAPFDGICSGDITVIEAIPNKIMPELLPFIIQNDTFFDFAMGKSAGSLSPRVKWEHLSQFELSLPSIKEQQKLTDLLWAANSTRQAYKELFNLTDEIVKSRFVEMFGDPVTNPMRWEVKSIGELFTMIRNGVNIKQDKFINGIPITRIESISDKEVNRSKMGYAGIYDISPYESYILQNDDILMSHINSVTHLGKTALYKRLKDEVIIHGMNLLCLRHIDKVDALFIYHFFQTNYFKFKISDITKPAVNQASFTIGDLKAIKAYFPPLDLQNQFAEFVKQADKSKFELQRNIDNLDATYKSIIRENLG